MRFRSATRPDQLAQSLVRHGANPGVAHLGSWERECARLTVLCETSITRNASE